MSMQFPVGRPIQATDKEYDAIIIGGGIYGISLALEAGRRGLKTLLLEKGDFGEYTSFNSLKIIHGGLRYLQSLDLHRFRESVKERSWFLRHFPQQVKPMPCLMPLYGRGLKRPSVFRIALLLNHLLALDRNKGLDPDHQLPVGNILSPKKSREIFPLVEMEGLQGSALWYDAQMEDSQLLIMDMLQLARETGTCAINYCQVEKILTAGGSVQGVSSLDRESGEHFEFKSNIVINAAGPWAGKLIEGLGGDADSIYRPSLAWNVLYKRPAPSSHALAVQAKSPGSRALFVTPWKGMIFAGCGHEPWTRTGSPDRPMPSRAQLGHFTDEVNEAIPGLNLGFEDIGRVFCGLLPTVETGSNVLTKREVIINHSQEGGPSGLYSIGGIKFTTARLVAEKIWGIIETGKPAQTAPAPVVVMTESVAGAQKELGSPVTDPDIVHLDDLVLRRSTLWEQGEDLDLDQLSHLFENWDDERRLLEIKRCSLRLEEVREELMEEATTPPHEGERL